MCSPPGPTYPPPLPPLPPSSFPPSFPQSTHLAFIQMLALCQSWENTDVSVLSSKLYPKSVGGNAVHLSDCAVGKDRQTALKSQTSGDRSKKKQISTELLSCLSSLMFPLKSHCRIELLSAPPSGLWSSRAGIFNRPGLAKTHHVSLPRALAGRRQQLLQLSLRKYRRSPAECPFYYTNGFFPEIGFSLYRRIIVFANAFALIIQKSNYSM